MQCIYCDAQVNEGSSFCSVCGMPMRAQMNGERNVMELPSFLRGSIVLRPGENVTGIWRASRQRRAHSAEGEKDDYDDGYLVSSNHRVFFIRESGRLRRSYSAIETIPYEKFTGATAKKGLVRNALIISHDRGETKIVSLSGVDGNGKSTGRSEAAETAQRVLNGDALARLHELERERRMGRVQYVLDFSFLKAEMERGGVVVQTIRCPACGAGIALPSSGSTTKCPYCGSMVQAQDIFEKMRGLVGSF